MTAITETDVTTDTKKKVKGLVFEKLMNRAKFIKPILDEFLKVIRPYVWILLGIYLSLIIPLLILIGLLIHTHIYIIHLSSK
jgi:hypothetical protein